MHVCTCMSGYTSRYMYELCVSVVLSLPLPLVHLHLVDYRRGEMTKKLFSVDLPFKCEAPKISMSPDGRVVAVGLDHSIYVYSCEDGELMETMEHVYQSK